MKTSKARRGCVAALLGVGALSPGCATYEPRPLDLDAHRAAWESRPIAEPMRAFVERLRGAGAPTPERFDPADGLSPAEGEVLALFYNPDLRLARLEAGVASATAEHAGRWADPEFGFDAAEILSPAGVFEYGLTLGLTLPVSGRLRAERARAGAAHEAALLRVVDAEWRTRAHVRRAWNRWVRAREGASLQRAALVGVEGLDSLVTRLEEAGEVTRAEARLFHVELASRRADLSRAEAEEAAARRALLACMGLAPTGEVELVPEPAPAGEGDTADPVAGLIARNTLLAVRRAEYRQAEESLRVEVRAQYPDITIGSGYGSEDGDDRLLLGLSLPVPLWNANRGPIAEASARREVARAAAEVEFERLAHELAGAQADLASARARREAYERAVTPLLEEQRRELARLGDLGVVETLVTLESVTREVEARSRLLELALHERDAAVRVAELIGPEWAAAAAPVGQGGER